MLATDPDSLDTFLADPVTYLDQSTNVEVIETHISKIYLTRIFAYKKKKAVKFDFLDYSTVQCRKLACQAELRLNGRLARGVYLKVIPVCRDTKGRLNLRENGEPIEWLVKMRRLNEANTLESRIRNGLIDQSEIDSLALMLSKFYCDQPPVSLKSEEFRDNLFRHVHANEHELSERLRDERPCVQDGIRRSHSAQLQFLNLQGNDICDRVCDGRIVDGHGDLRPEHVYFEPRPSIIDCIEFSAEFRTNDIVDELAFLGMECDHLGSAEIGLQLLNAYRQASQDEFSSRLVAFYKCYRACVRAKVHCLRATQMAADAAADLHQTARAYLSLANSYVRDFAPNLIISVGGLMGTGKSTLALAVSQALAGQTFHTDVVRKDSVCDAEPLAGPPEQSYGQGNYVREKRELVYDEMIRRAAARLKETPTIVLDGTFSSAASRSKVAELARSSHANWLHVECGCSNAVSLNRLARRHRVGDPIGSEARPDLYAQQRREYDPPTSDEPVLSVDTSQPTGRQVDAVLAAIRTRASG
jgi:aminoglycoside phosphotransferase family enzyme/predicted kinase